MRLRADAQQLAHRGLRAIRCNNQPRGNPLAAVERQLYRPGTLRHRLQTRRTDPARGRLLRCRPERLPDVAESNVVTERRESSVCGRETRYAKTAALGNMGR